jgi:hypothetical protein
MICDLVEKEALPGDVAELGVYKGNTAFLLTDLARRVGRTAYLFDTFTSLPERDFIGIDSSNVDRKNDFMDNSIGPCGALSDRRMSNSLPDISRTVLRMHQQRPDMR